MPELTWRTERFQRPGVTTYTLQPDHPAHQKNMAEMTRLERKILRAYLEAVLETLNMADGE